MTLAMLKQVVDAAIASGLDPNDVVKVKRVRSGERFDPLINAIIDDSILLLLAEQKENER